MYGLNKGAIKPMKPVLFTDFDRTMIFSKRFLDESVDSTCIEYKEGKPMSFMTNNAITLLDEVKQKLVFIPVTTRTWELITRVDFIKEDMPEWLVCCNGGRIYHNGEQLQEWEKMMQQEREKLQYPVNTVGTVFRQVFQSDVLEEVLIYEQCYVMVKFDKMTQEIERLLEKLQPTIQQMGYRIEVSSRKAYVFPNFIRKERAVQFLIDKLNVEVSISAGDSIMDLEMLRLTDYAVAPNHKTFEENFMEVTQHTGLLAGEEILRYIQRISQKVKVKDN